MFLTGLALAVATDSNHKKKQHVLDVTHAGLHAKQRHRIGYAKASTVGDETLERMLGFLKKAVSAPTDGKESIVVKTMFPANTRPQPTFMVTYDPENDTYDTHTQMHGQVDHARPSIPKGSFKTVYKATIPEGSLPSPNERVTDVAIGVQQGVQQTDMPQASKELELNKQLMEQSPSMTNLLETYGGLKDDEGGKSPILTGGVVACISVTPIANGGNVGSLVSEIGKTWSEFKNSSHLPLPLVKSLLKQILNGVAEAHAAHVVNYDIKPTKMVLTSKLTDAELAGNAELPKGVVKISDFGHGKKIGVPSKSRESSTRQRGRTTWVRDL